MPASDFCQEISGGHHSWSALTLLFSRARLRRYSKHRGGMAMLEVRQDSDHELEALVGGTQLRAMDRLYIDDVLAVVDCGLDRLPPYLDLNRKAANQAWTTDALHFT